MSASCCTDGRGREGVGGWQAPSGLWLFCKHCEGRGKPVQAAGFAFVLLLPPPFPPSLRRHWGEKEAATATAAVLFRLAFSELGEAACAQWSGGLERVPGQGTGGSYAHPLSKGAIYVTLSGCATSVLVEDAGVPP